MKSFGHKAHFEYVTCLNHTINLAVLDTMFPKKEQIFTGDSEGNSGEEDEFSESIHVPNETFSSTIARMRDIINSFRCSPVKNNLLQSELVKQYVKNLELIMFTKTRWNSLVISGRRFLKLLPAVEVTLIELNSTLPWDDENTELLKVSFEI